MQCFGEFCSGRLGPLATFVFGLALLSTPACLELDDCSATDITCNGIGWLLYLQNADAGNAAPARCGGGTSGSAFYSFYGATGSDSISATCATSDGGTILAGRSTADIASLGGVAPGIAYNAGNDALIIKLDAANAVEWYSFTGGPVGEAFFGVTEAQGGGFVAVGEATGDLGTLGGKAPVIAFQSTPDWLVVSYTSSGAVDWWTYIGSGGADLDEGMSVAELSGGGFVVGGHAGDLTGMPVANLSTHAGNFDQTFVKLSATGAVEWYRSFGSTVNEQSREIVATADGGFVSTGLGLGDIINVGGAMPIIARHGSQDTLVAKFTASGALEWFTFLGAAGGLHIGNSITELTDGSFVVGMTATSDVATLDGKAPLSAFITSDMYLARLTAAGALDWHTFLPTAAVESFSHVAALTDGSFIAGGFTDGAFATLNGQTPLNAYVGGDEMVLVRMAADGSQIWFSFVGGAGNEEVKGLAGTRDGGFVLSGESSANIGSLGGLTPLIGYSNFIDGFVLRGSADGPF